MVKVVIFVGATGQRSTGTGSVIKPKAATNVVANARQADRCYDTIAPPPWDAVFLAAWDDMTSQLAGHVASAGYSDTVVALRLTGLNASTAETHLPAQSPAKLSNPPACLTVDSVAVWQAAGYTPIKIQTAWSAMVTSWATHFPGLPFELVLWPGVNNRFPPIDDSGTIVTPTAAADQARYDAMVAEAARQLGSRLMVGTWFLMNGTAADAVTVGYANQYGIATLWQTNLWRRSYETGSDTLSKRHPRHPPDAHPVIQLRSLFLVSF